MQFEMNCVVIGTESVGLLERYNLQQKKNDLCRDISCCSTCRPHTTVTINIVCRFSAITLLNIKGTTRTTLSNTYSFVHASTRNNDRAKDLGRTQQLIRLLWMCLTGECDTAIDSIKHGHSLQVRQKEASAEML